MTDTQALFRALMGREIDCDTSAGLADRDLCTVALELMFSTEFTNTLLFRAVDWHGLFIHRARQMMIRSLLPVADRILDLGGANAPLYRSGYPLTFKQMVMVDLPPDDRHAMYQDVVVEDTAGVTVHYCDMTLLDNFEANAFDLVWSGQSIEHVEFDSAVRMIAEAFRVLTPGGYFCLDTPNRELTKIHTRSSGGGFIHPDHRHEFTATELRILLLGAGFEIIDERGICEMQRSRTGEFDYADFVLGNHTTPNIEDGYLLFFKCRKPSPAEAILHLAN